MGRRKSGQDNRRSSEPIDRRKSGQYERKASEPIDHLKSAQDARRASAPFPHRESGQEDQAPYELIDSRKSGLVERKVYEQVEHRLSDPIGYKTSVKTHHKAHDQIIELAEDQAAEDQVAVSTRHPRVIMPLYSEYEKVVDEDDIDDDQPDLEESDESDGRIHTSKKGKEADSKLDRKQKDFRDSKVSDKTKSENDAFMKAFNAFDSKVTSALQTKDHNFSPRFPAISTKLDYVINQEKSHIIVTKPDNTSEYQEERSSVLHYHKKRFPSLVYQDPYQVSLQYMEKHHILQIFQQITENLVYEKPEDPLSFMLSQVKKMIKSREKNSSDQE
ncbi:testis-specific expressed protein 55 [Eptesicus fuscus]|uniref:testis-specific expressed protein 55 n=1 Tax=Eptesicus fuscus TaxID=29078 RepID=UPI002403CE93|nr:testis-specific expressed protein 55 [Eptesicus fuscus]